MIDKRTVEIMIGIAMITAVIVFFIMSHGCDGGYSAAVYTPEECPTCDSCCETAECPTCDSCCEPTECHDCPEYTLNDAFNTLMDYCTLECQTNDKCIHEYCVKSIKLLPSGHIQCRCKPCE